MMNDVYLSSVTNHEADTHTVSCAVSSLFIATRRKRTHIHIIRNSLIGVMACSILSSLLINGLDWLVMVTSFAALAC